MRRLVDLLRETADGTDGRVATAEPVARLVERFSKHGPPVQLHMSPDATNPPWPLEVTTTVYRIVQEALTNIVRHAPDARSVTVTIGHDPRRVTVEITNDAPLFAPVGSRQGSGYGLVGMRERVEALGGRLDAGPLPTPGWSVRAAVPLHVGAQS